MSISNKSAELAELKTLRGHLSNLDRAQKEVQTYESKIRNLNNKSADDVHVYQERTDRYEEAYRKFTAENGKKRGNIAGKFLVAAVVILVIMGVIWLIMGGVFAGNTHLHTPEIVREYTGVYYNVQGHERNCKITITSCKENGKFEGTFEFFGEDAYTDEPFYGKYSVTGKITTKSAEGYVNATLEFKEWIERPSGWDPLEDLQLKIYDNYEAIRCFDYNMCLYASDYKKPATVTNLKTPEIIGTYSGKFTPPTGKTGDAILTIESCDENGFVTGLFEYTFEYTSGKGTDKCTWNGQITKKYDNGSLVLTLEPDEDLASGYMFYDPTTMEIEIYDDYRSVDSLEGIHWFYEDEGLKKDPDVVNSPTRQMAKKTAPIVFPAYIAVAFVVLIILSGKKTNIFTEEQQRSLNELLKQDEQSKAKNENARKQAIVQAQKDKRKDQANYHQWLEGAKQREQEAAYLCSQMRILSDKDKTLENVEFLIEKMESGRADSLKEALNLLDADIHRRRESFMRAELAHQESMRRMQAEAEARRDQMYHNLNVEYQQRRQAEELEKIRKALED